MADEYFHKTNTLTRYQVLVLITLLVIVSKLLLSKFEGKNAKIYIHRNENALLALKHKSVFM